MAGLLSWYLYQLPAVLRFETIMDHMFQATVDSLVEGQEDLQETQGPCP